MKSSPSQHPKAPFIVRCFYLHVIYLLLLQLSRYCDHAFRKGVRSTCDPDGNWINDAVSTVSMVTFLIILLSLDNCIQVY